MIECTINGIYLKMHTERSLFSPNHIDRGTIAMVSKIEFQAGQKILDLGCGYGVIGIYAAHFSGAENVTMVDINPIAVEFAKKNAIYNDLGSINIFQSDGLNSIIEQDLNGYYIFISQKRMIRKTKIENKHRLSKKLQRKCFSILAFENML